MYLEIITPDNKAFEGEVTGVKVPGEAGTFEMLNNHAAIISTLVSGQVRVSRGKDHKFFQIDGGILEMQNNKAIILAESAKPE